MRSSKSFVLFTVAAAMVLLLIVGAATVIIDPFFHYHGPLTGLQYPINNQRYQNSGIVKNFSYDALITGTSLTENFKTSEFDALFGVNSIKVSFSGGSSEELLTNLQKALEANPNIRYVLYGIDSWNLLTGRDLIEADGDFPLYLYDDDLFNDVEYIFNKDVFCNNTLGVLRYTAEGNTTTSFDAYSSWNHPSGAEAVIQSYDRPELAEAELEFTDEDAATLSNSLRQGILRLALEHPDIQFLCFFPPYSILSWDLYLRMGELPHQTQQFILATEILLEAENIQLFSFYNDYETITNLDNYSDSVHYTPQINSLLLQRMRDGEYLLTKDNYQAHWQEFYEFYNSYDYDALLTGALQD